MTAKSKSLNIFKRFIAVKYERVNYQLLTKKKRFYLCIFWLVKICKICLFTKHVSEVNLKTKLVVSHVCRFMYKLDCSCFCYSFPSWFKLLKNRSILLFLKKSRKIKKFCLILVFITWHEYERVLHTIIWDHLESVEIDKRRL